MDFVIGGAAAVCAGFFTNPLEVVKTRMQLQGELASRGKHAVHYKNLFHAAFVVAKHDGILALQAGLVPASLFQLSINSVRFGELVPNADFQNSGTFSFRSVSDCHGQGAAEGPKRRVGLLQNCDSKYPRGCSWGFRQQPVLYGEGASSVASLQGNQVWPSAQS